MALSGERRSCSRRARRVRRAAATTERRLEHLLLAQQCSDRDCDGAVRTLAGHLGRAGLTLVAQIDAHYEAVLVQGALAQVIPGQ